MQSSGGCVASRVGLDVLGEIKSLAPVANQTTIPRSCFQQCGHYAAQDILAPPILTDVVGSLSLKKNVPLFMSIHFTKTFLRISCCQHTCNYVEIQGAVLRTVSTFSVDKKNQLDVTFCILYFSSNSCSTCFGQPCAHHQELTIA